MNLENQVFFKEFFCSRTHRMKPIAFPSLQHVTMVKLAIEFWNQIDFRESILNYRLNGDHRSNLKKWREMEEKVLSKADQLFLSEMLKKEFQGVISPIGLEIKNWWEYHQLEINISKSPNQFIWTVRGTIDLKRTAEMLVKDEEMDIDERYKLACLYCLEDELPELWKHISDERKQEYSNIDVVNGKTTLTRLVRYWTYHLNGMLSEVGDWLKLEVYFYVFERAIKGGNIVASEFFISKITNKDRDYHMVSLAKTIAKTHSNHHLQIGNSITPKKYYSEIFLFLLMRMSDDQRREVFHHCPYELLECLLEWPNRPLFVEMAERTLRSIDNNRHYRNLMSMIINNIANGLSDCTSRQLFHHFWNLCPLSYKRRAIEQIDYCTILKLYEGNDVGIIRALFQHACAEEKEGLIMCRRERDISSSELLKKNGWEPLEDIEIKFRNEFLERGMN